MHIRSLAAYPSSVVKEPAPTTSTQGIPLPRPIANPTFYQTPPPLPQNSARRPLTPGPAGTSMPIFRGSNGEPERQDAILRRGPDLLPALQHHLLRRRAPPPLRQPQVRPRLGRAA